MFARRSYLRLTSQTALVGRSCHRRNHTALFNPDVATGWLTTVALQTMAVLLLYSVLALNIDDIRCPWYFHCQDGRVQ